jgi:hypothetical protein
MLQQMDPDSCGQPKILRALSMSQRPCISEYMKEITLVGDFSQWSHNLPLWMWSDVTIYHCECTIVNVKWCHNLPL